jgi:hypothetical protein
VVPGNFYKFKVAATNELGESYLTAYVEVLAATFPNPPILEEDALIISQN